MPKVNTTEMKNIIIRVASEEGVDPSIMLAIAEQESGFNPNARNKSKVEDSVGMFQINTKAHPDYKGGFDPVANARYAARHLKGLLAATNGDLAQAIAAYNGGMGGRKSKQAQGYSKSVQNRMSKYSTVSRNAERIATNINDIPNIRIGSRAGEVTGAAAPVNVTIPDPVLMGNPFQETPDTYINRATDAQNLKNLYTMAATSRPSSTNMTDAELRAYNTALTPVNAQDYIDMQNAQNNAVLQLQQQLARRDATAQQALADRYAEIEALYNQDPRLVNQGYYIDPNSIAQDARADVGMALAFNNPQLMKDISPENIARRQYEAQVANQYGVPYAQYMAAEQDRIRNIVGLKAAQIEQAVAQMKANGATDQEIAKALNNSEFVKQYTEDVKNLRTTAGNLYQHTMANDPLYSNALVNQAGGIIQEGQRANVLGATGAADYQTGIDKQLVQNVPSLYATNVGAATTNYGNQLDYDIAQQNVDINRSVAPSRAFGNTMTGFANMAIGTQANPNLDLGGVIQGLPAQTRRYIVGNATPQQVQQIYGNPTPQGNATSASSLTDKFLNYFNRVRRPEDAQ